MTSRTENTLDVIVIAAAAGTILRISLSPFWWTDKALISSGICLLIATVSAIRIVVRAVRGRRYRKRMPAPVIRQSEVEKHNVGPTPEPVLLKWDKDPSGTLTATVRNGGHTLLGMICPANQGQGWHCRISHDGRPVFEADAETVESARQLIINTMMRYIG